MACTAKQKTSINEVLVCWMLEIQRNKQKSQKPVPTPSHYCLWCCLHIRYDATKFVYIYLLLLWNWDTADYPRHSGKGIHRSSWWSSIPELFYKKIELCLETITRVFVKEMQLHLWKHCIVSIPDVSVSVKSHNCLPFNFSFRGALTEKFNGHQKSTEIKFLAINNRCQWFSVALFPTLMNLLIWKQDGLWLVSMYYF